MLRKKAQKIYKIFLDKAEGPEKENNIPCTSRKKNMESFYTVWKFQEFSITQILREINFEDFRSAKSAILTHLEALKLDF